MIEEFIYRGDMVQVSEKMKRRLNDSEFELALQENQYSAVNINIDELLCYSFTTFIE